MLRYAIDETPFSVPASSDPETLNSLIKSLLNEKLNEDSDEMKEDLASLEFDFYIISQIIQTSIDEFLRSSPEIKIVNEIFYFNLSRKSVNN